MSEFLRLTASDQHQFDAWHAPAEGVRRGSVVVVQEIFGVNDHIRDVCDRFAADGYDAIAPALFDRVRHGVSLDYNEAGISAGRDLAAEIGWDGPVLDIEAAARAVRGDGRVGVVGYCWGASWTWMAACRLSVGCAVCYYGRHIVGLLDEQPRCPVMLHFGAEDGSIPLTDVDTIRAAKPDLPLFVYQGAGHGFNCDRRGSFDTEAAALALQRTEAFFAENLD